MAPKRHGDKEAPFTLSPALRDEGLQRVIPSRKHSGRDLLHNIFSLIRCQEKLTTKPPRHKETLKRKGASRIKFNLCNLLALSEANVWLPLTN
ncbi:MAG: hypothetical protein QME16_04270, partial [Planctomycetota bacterium]|nr:hypothetical protein [Planctomycetota bacterium]